MSNQKVKNMSKVGPIATEFDLMKKAFSMKGTPTCTYSDRFIPDTENNEI